MPHKEIDGYIGPRLYDQRSQMELFETVVLFPHIEYHSCIELGSLQGYNRITPMGLNSVEIRIGF